ncbi:MAG: hypothetical protein Q7S33_01575 [Nanoarchaeota archaeon]|nr:hypothetical protein [Nanoarchaeota archaeon]
MRKKVGELILIFALILFSFSFVIAADSSSNQNKTNKAYSCLESKVIGKCSSLSIPEIAFTILASPAKNVSDECKKALIDKKATENCWPKGNCNVKETALAILALNSLGADTKDAEKWLLSKNKTATDLIWYLQQDSNEAASCTVSYNSNSYQINIASNKKISGSAGDCLTTAQSGFWLQVAPNCYDQEFSVSCDKKFISTLLYKQQNSNTLHVLEGTKSAEDFGTINLKINAKCLSASSECNFEENVWASLALQKTNHNIDEFTPYLVASADSNQRFLPNAFIYMLTNENSYAEDLIKEQQVGNYWQAESSAYNKYYDSALALIALKQSSSDKITKARSWALFIQNTNGCWQDSIRDTAIMLWALGGRTSTFDPSTGTTTCSEGNFFCVPTADCSAEETLSNYFCSGLSTVCCKTEKLQTCSALSGIKCGTGKVCQGLTKKALDVDSCCLGDCGEPATECEANGNICRTSCSVNQQKTTDACTGTQVCCKAIEAPTPTKTWIYILIAGIIIVAGIIIFLLRDKIKLALFKSKSKFKEEGKGKSSPSSSPPGFPPRPGFPPIRRPMPPMQMRRPIARPAPARKDVRMDDTFKKLREMTR